MSWIQNQAIMLALPMVAGVLSSLGYQYVKKASAWIDALPPQAHAFVIGAIAIVLPAIGKVVPGFEATSLAGVDASVIQSLILLAAAKVTHKHVSA